MYSWAPYSGFRKGNSQLKKSVFDTVLKNIFQDDMLFEATIGSVRAIQLATMAHQPAHSRILAQHANSVISKLRSRVATKHATSDYTILAILQLITLYASLLTRRIVCHKLILVYQLFSRRDADMITEMELHIAAMRRIMGQRKTGGQVTSLDGYIDFRILM
jgi:hypothetical protein